MARFTALSNTTFKQIRESNQTSHYNLTVIDLGYANAPKKTCGLAWKDSVQISVDNNFSFGTAIQRAKERLPSTCNGKKPLLVIEAPLSTRHEDGCPAFRGKFEESRGWYYNGGAIVALGALRFLRELSQGLHDLGCEIYVAEAFLSNKKNATKHRKDAKRILDEFWQDNPECLYDDGMEPLTELISGIPCVRVFPPA